ncbi:carbohydrate ABC transporter permease [Vallitalea okinawensis]|uniref:carbohydrate ABC transporter permease n=1 Tax=Vallitalea okinawensis TaxID=2078660 RepID=UPI000CFD1930|nr:sugar ABC transporter permease [Vallitalea okinawensis]
MAKRKLSQLDRRKRNAGLLFVLPTVIGLVGLTIYPMILSLYYSFTDKQIGHSVNFIKLDNYKELLTNDPLFWKSMIATFKYALLSVPVVIILSFFIAILLNQKVKGLPFFRTIFYIPTIVPAIANAVLWMWLFNPNFGVLNTILEFLHLPTSMWIFSAKSAVPSLVLMRAWEFGGTMIIFLAGLQGIPPTLYEACEIDGGSALKKLWYVTIPLMTPIIFFNLVMLIIWSLQAFSQAYVMTEGGPNYATYFFNYYLYQEAFEFGRMGYASALAWILFMIILILTAITFKNSKMWVYKD